MEDNQEIDVAADSSSEQSEQNNNQASESSSNDSREAAPAPKADPQVPFHEHPRFKELIEEKNTFKSRLEENERTHKQQYADMQAKLEAFQKASTPKQEDALMARLKGIDPEFADRFGKLGDIETLKQELQQVQSWKQEMAQERVRHEAVSARDKFYADNKVPADKQGIYNALLSHASNSNPNLGLKDLPKMLKDVHDQISKVFTSAQRDATKQLVEGKKADGSKPTSQPKGQPVKPGKPEFSKNPGEAKAQLIKDILAETRANKDI